MQADRKSEVGVCPSVGIAAVLVAAMLTATGCDRPKTNGNDVGSTSAIDGASLDATPVSTARDVAELLERASPMVCGDGSIVDRVVKGATPTLPRSIAEDPASPLVTKARAQVRLSLDQTSMAKFDPAAKIAVCEGRLTVTVQDQSLTYPIAYEIRTATRRGGDVQIFPQYGGAALYAFNQMAIALEALKRDEARSTDVPTADAPKPDPQMSNEDYDASSPARGPTIAIRPSPNSEDGNVDR